MAGTRLNSSSDSCLLSAESSKGRANYRYKIVTSVKWMATQTCVSHFFEKSSSSPIIVKRRKKNHTVNWIARKLFRRLPSKTGKRRLTLSRSFRFFAL